MGCGASKSADNSSNNKDSRPEKPIDTTGDVTLIDGGLSDAISASPKRTKSFPNLKRHQVAAVRDGHVKMEDYPSLWSSLETFRALDEDALKGMATVCSSFLIPVPPRGEDAEDDDDIDPSDIEATARAATEKGVLGLNVMSSEGSFASAVRLLFDARGAFHKSCGSAVFKRQAPGAQLWRLPKEIPVTESSDLFVSMDERVEYLTTKPTTAAVQKELKAALVGLSEAASLLLGDIALFISLRVDRKRLSLSEGIESVLDDLKSGSSHVIGRVVEREIGAANKDSPMELLASCVQAALKALAAIGGGWATIVADDVFASREEDTVLARLLEVEGLNLLISLLKHGTYNPSRGMHSVDMVQTDLAAMRKLLQATGFLSPKCGTSFKEWLEELPLFALNDESRSILLYLHCVLEGQKSLKIAPILRARFMESTVTAMKKVSGQDVFAGGTSSVSSEKVFPIFAKEGVGLESGEGHGPRKEFFDSLGMALISPAHPEIDVSSAVQVRTLSPSEAHAEHYRSEGGSVILLKWLGAKLISHFAAGDVITLQTANNADDGASSPGETSLGSERAVEEKFTVLAVVSKTGRKVSAVIHKAQAVDDDDDDNITTASPRDGAEWVALALNGTSTIPNDRIRTVKVVQAAHPLFAHDTGKRFAWINAALKVNDSTIAAEHALAGWGIANAVANGTVVPCSMPPFLFATLRKLALTRRNNDSTSKSVLWSKTLRPCEDDLGLIDASYDHTVTSIGSMDAPGFEAILEAEGLGEDEGFGINHGDLATQKRKYIDDIIIDEGVFPQDRVHYMQRLTDGFAKVGIDRCPVFFGSSSRQLQRVFCGLTDDGFSNFSFAAWFRLIPDENECSPTAKFLHSRVYFDIVISLIEETFDAAMKRQLLKFITGRSLLPARPRAEHIKLEFPLSPMVARDFDKALERLPASHSCDNVFELPNVMEAVLFGSDSIWYVLTGKPVGGVIMDHDRAGAFEALDTRQQGMVTRHVMRTLKRKLTQAVQQTDTYELDENVIDDKQRKLYDACFPGSPTRPPSNDAAASQSPAITPSRTASDVMKQSPRRSSSVESGPRSTPGSSHGRGGRRGQRLEVFHTTSMSADETDTAASPPNESPRPPLYSSGALNGSNSHISDTAGRPPFHPQGGTPKSELGGSSSSNRLPPINGSEAATLGGGGIKRKDSSDLDELMDELGYSKPATQQ